MKINILLDNILIQKSIYESKNPNDRIICVISTNNKKLIISAYEEITQTKEIKISTFELFGMKVFPSDFISDNQILISEIIEI